MVLPISDYLAISGDSYAPQSPNPSLQQYDNYQIYTLICLDQPYTLTGWQRRFFELFTPYTRLSSGQVYGGSYRVLSSPNLEYISSDGLQRDWIAIQSYSPKAIPIDFAAICQSLIVQPRNYYNQIRIVNIIESTIDTAVVPNYVDFVPIPNPFDAQNILDTVNFEALNLSNPLQFSWLETTFDHSGAVDPTNGFYLISSYTRQTKKAIFADDSIANPIPSYKSLIGGYAGDTRIQQPNNPSINIPLSGKLEIGYYRPNLLEPIQNLISLDWVFYEIDIVQFETIHLSLIDVVLGTLILNGEPDLVDAVKLSLSTLDYPDRYSWSHYYHPASAIFSEWIGIYNSIPLPVKNTSPNLLLKSWLEYGTSKSRVLAANNNHWLNSAYTPSDLNFDITHPLFQIDSLRAYNWYIKPAVEGIGTLTMDSPRTIEIHAALEAGKYAINELDPTIGRVSNLGHLVNRISELLGYRVDANGKLDVNKEKDNYIRQEKNKDVKEEEYGGNSFTSKGMLVRRLSNKFDKKGIIDGGVMGIHDIPQLILECLDQHNLAIGLQESSAIEIRNGDQVYRYPNQLALLTDIFIHQVNQSKYAKSTFISSLVTQEQTKEIIGGMGLPTIQKTIPNMINGSLARIPFWGIAPQASLSRKIDTCSYNVGVVLGQLI